MVRLGNVCEILNGYAFKSENYTDTGVRIIRISNVQKGYIEDNTPVFYPFNDINVEKYKLFEGDVLLSLTGNVGRVGLLEKKFLPAALNQRVACIRIKDDTTLDKSFLFNLLNSDSFEQKCILSSKGVAQKNMSTEWLKDYKISLPPLDEQRKIAAVLDKVSDLIAKRRQQLDKLNELIKARFVEMFGDCKQNPKNWSVWDLEDIAQVGSSKRVFVEELKESGIPFYRGTEVGALAEGKKIEPELFITEKHYDELCQVTGRPQIGDLLMPSICPDGRIWVVDSEKPFYFKDGRVLWVHDINKNVNSTFLLYTLKNRIMADYSSIASGTTFAELKIFSLKKCKIFNVPTELQNQFAAFVEQTEKTKTTISKSLEKLETLKKALMQEYFG